ncbi:MAG TPA: hypothetical protein VK464_10425 [Symbiobacteriaceae bacterium]|jgi:hypothetical protein|nr:hypothetical protein [Symbiobacteriaceae bacterium]
MWRKLIGFLHSDRGGISTYVAQAVMIMAVLSAALLIIAATNNLGRFMIDRVQNFMTHAAPK